MSSLRCSKKRKLKPRDDIKIEDLIPNPTISPWFIWSVPAPDKWSEKEEDLDEKTRIIPTIVKIQKEG